MIPQHLRDTTLRVHDRLEAATGRSIPLRLWDGTLVGPADRPYRLVIHHPSALRALLLSPNDLRAGQLYAFGDVDVHGDMVALLHDITALRGHRLPRGVRATLLSTALRLPSAPRRRDGRRARLAGSRHSIDRDRAAVQFHYDLGNDFFQLFLDQRLVYSCAYFAAPDEPLDPAQERKLDLVCRKLRLQPGERLLDVGCGWGALVAHAAERYGVTAVGVTVSARQAELARERIARAGLAARVTILLADYREVEGTFDAVASVGMFEHVGPDHLAAYFATCFRLTARGGRFLNHGITTGRRAATVDFSRQDRSFAARYVFPDGGLVPAWTAVRHVQEAGFEVVDLEQLRSHYALTLRRWLERLESNREAAVGAASEVDYRVWRAYLAASVVGFETGDLGVVQVLGSKGAALPLGRSWMLPPARRAADVMPGVVGSTAPADELRRLRGWS
ncbi:MAG TPA: cyclopropane-fatty-acyl-phospholipid synthase family protein [Nitriliruptorales bacterium]|nr:cyclopropane-fatty-acyl-phospholipid synthase family protein [Nitriliruptorales bacterium]